MKNLAIGILLLSHGGSAQWNQSVKEVQREVSARFPVEVAFGMADPVEIQGAVEKLEARGVKKIVAVPLFISSHSEVIDQTKYVLGMAKAPSKDFMSAPHSHFMAMGVRRVRARLPLVLAPALDDSPTAAAILLDRAREMSRDPSKETVLLVGHGPLKDSDDRLWLAAMQRLADDVKRRGGFAQARVATLRDDSPPDVQEKADRRLREMVNDSSRTTKVLVIPYLISTGGIEAHIQKALDGTFYAWKGRALLPDPRIAGWVEQSAAQAGALPDMRLYKGGADTYAPADSYAPRTEASDSYATPGIGK